MRKWTVEDLRRMRDILKENDWNLGVAQKIYFSEVPQNDSEQEDATKAFKIMIRDKEQWDRIKKRHAST